MQYIKAPFNFVAVSNKVYFPDWADQISHDVPFSDGLSGQLEIELEAKTPIFIRDSKHETLFCHVQDGEQKKYFIPGTSLKGTIRSVFEILTFAKMDKINDHKFAIRDLHNPMVYNLMKDSKNIRCGWLSIEKDENGKETGSIRDCDFPWRISHQQLDSKFGTKFVETFKAGGIADFSKDSNKTAEYKYNLLTPATSLTSGFKKTTETYGKQLCDFDSSGEKGTLIFTGQAGARKTTGRPSGKFYEFVFVEQPTPAAIKVDAKTWEEFKFHYFDHDSKNISADWKWRKGQLKRGKEIPVFFRLNPKDNLKVKDLGLAYLYKMPYKHSVKELLSEEHRLGFFKPDMAECIFGNANETDALKGRVQFSTAWADMDTVKEGEQITTILGTPKASYYPLYIKQNGEKGKVYSDNNGRPVYKTYMDDNAELAGRKRYPVRESALGDLPAGTDGMKVSFAPLASGTKFTAKIRYFNLRPAELGALLSALTFHNNATTCYHGLGMAKPYGFGRVSLKILNDVGVHLMSEYLDEFESEINAYMKVDNHAFKWHESEQIREFIAMAKIQGVEDRLAYMKMDRSEFAEAKKKENGFYLEDYCSITGSLPEITSFSKTKKIEEKETRSMQAREQLKKEIKCFKDKEKLHQEELAKQARQKKEKQLEKEKEAVARARIEIQKKEEEEEQKRSEELKQKQQALDEELEKKREEEKKRIEERIKQLKKSGLEPIIQDINKFKQARRQIDSYMKHIDVRRLDDRDTNSLMKKASEWYISTPNKQKEKRWKPNDGPDWRKIASWIGDEPAKKWYNNLTGNE